MFINYLIVFLISMVPIVELRGAIPVAVGMGLDPVISYIVCIVGNMLPVPIIYLFARNIEEVSKLETPLSTISIFIFVFPLVVSLFIFFEKKRAYKFNEILLFLENCISSESK